MLNKRKLLIRTAAVLIALICLLIVIATVLVSRSTHQFNEFKREHPDAQKIVADVIRPALELATTTETRSRVVAPTCHEPPGPELQGLGQDFVKARPRIRIAAPFTLRRTIIRIPIDEFPEEGKTGPIPCGPGLRRRILDGVATNTAGWKMLHIKNQSVNTTLPTAVQLKPFLDRAEKILSRPDWPLIEQPVETNGNGARYATELFAQLALYRARLKGQQELAAAMFVNVIRLNLAAAPYNYTHYRAGGLHVSADRMFWAMIDMPGSQGGLEQAAAILARARLSEKQAAELRAARAMSVGDYFSHTIPGSLADTPNSDALSVKCARLFDPLVRATAWAIISPSARSWAGGDADEYFVARNRLATLSKISYRISGDRLDEFADMFQSEDAGFGSEHPFNREIDRLQLIVAIGRYKQANGHYPDSIEQIIPQYLSRSSLGKDTAYGVAVLPAGIYPAVSPNQIEKKKYFATAVENYRKKFGRLPQNAAELRAFDGDDRLSNSLTMFIHMDERPVIYTVRRHTEYRADIEYWRDRAAGAIDTQIYDEYLAKFKPGAPGLEVLNVEAFSPEPDRFRPEVLELLK